MCGYQKFFPLDDGLDFFYSSLKKKAVIILKHIPIFTFIKMLFPIY